MTTTTKHVALSIASPRLTVRISHRRTRAFRSRHLVRRLAFPEIPWDPFDVEEGDDEIDHDEFLREFDKLLNEQSFNFEVGQRVEGLVFDVDDSGVYIDYGAKEIGFCSNTQMGLLKVSHPEDLLKPNSRHLFDIGAKGVLSKRMGVEVTLLNRVNIVKEVAFKRLRQMSEFQIKMPAEVIEKNAGGYQVKDEMGMTGFLPGRQTLGNTAFRSADEDELVGQKIIVKILDLFEDSNRYLVTQRGIVGPEIDESRFAMGTVLQGVVEGVMPYGVFIKAGGISGLLHASQITSGRLEDVASVFSVNDPVKVMVLGYDRNRGRLSFSTKKLEPNAGDMLKDPDIVYNAAEEMAEKFRKEVELAAARIQTTEFEPILSDVSLDTSRFA